MENRNEDPSFDPEKVDAPSQIKHEDLRSLLYWKGRTVMDWTEDDVKLGHLIRKLHYHPTAELTDEDKAVVRRVVLDRSQSEDKINDLSHLKMWIPVAAGRSSLRQKTSSIILPCRKK